MGVDGFVIADFEDHARGNSVDILYSGRSASGLQFCFRGIGGRSPDGFGARGHRLGRARRAIIHRRNLSHGIGSGLTTGRLQRDGVSVRTLHNSGESAAIPEFDGSGLLRSGDCRGGSAGCGTRGLAASGEQGKKKRG